MQLSQVTIQIDIKYTYGMINRAIKKNLHMMQKWNVILLRWHTLSTERYISMAMPFRKTLLQPR